jgi:DNA-binding response OmpR family regulator
MAVLEEARTVVRTYLIEPQTTFVAFLERALADAGLDVVAVSAAVDIERIASTDPDAVLVDVDFLERGGPSALCAVRTAAPCATILAYTEDDDEGFSAVCTIAGTDAVIAKSFGPSEFADAVRRSLALRRRSA